MWLLPKKTEKSPTQACAKLRILHSKYYEGFQLNSSGSHDTKEPEDKTEQTK